MKTLVFAVTLMLSTLGLTQSKFQATATGDNGGTIFQHHDTSSNGQVNNSAISTSSATGFTSPATVLSTHIGGKDYAINPDAGVINIGQIQFGTGLFNNGDLSNVALFDSADLSYVTVTTNGSCGQFKTDLSCKPNGFTPNGPVFTGVFVGTISWNTLPDSSHMLSGTVMGVVNGKNNPVFLSFVATTVPENHSAFQNGQERINTVTIQEF